MASLIEELIQVLEDETGCYEALVAMADNKKDVIISGDVPSLQDMVKHEQDLAGRILRSEKKRQELISDIALVTNQDERTLTVMRLVELLKGQEFIADKLQQAAMNLMDVVEEMKAANDLNQKLIEQSLEFVDFTMNAIQSAKSPVNQNNYNQHSKGYDNQQRGFFDAKQ